MRQIHKKLLLLLFLTSLSTSTFAQYDKVSISGTVKSKDWKTGLIGAKICLIDAMGTVIDSTETGKQKRYNNVTKEYTAVPTFSFNLPHIAARYNLEISYPGYETTLVSIDLTDLANREISRDLPTIFLKKAAINLDEVVVTATKVKFYNKGDTLVYNADAFQLAEGSMLDALVSQLPGVEIKDNGQIYVNGKFVESLLLNGRDFFTNDNQLMLENLGAYIVKNIAVYTRTNDYEKEMKINEANKQELVMDVRLKKEYQQSWIFNLEAGGGTRDRYLGRFFGLRFTNHSQVGVYGNINNLNDSRKPGQSSTWTPENFSTGERIEKLVGLEYNFDLLDSKVAPKGTLRWSHSSLNETNTTNQTNLLPGGNNFVYKYSSNKNYNSQLYEYNTTAIQIPNHWINFSHRVDYRSKESNSASVSATFDNEFQNMNRQIIEDIYTSGSAEEKNSLVNRYLQSYKVKGSTLNTMVEMLDVYKVKKSNDHLYSSISYNYSREKNDTYKNYQINYGKNDAAATNIQEYYKNSPNRQYTIEPRIEYEYTTYYGKIRPGYRFTHTSQYKDAYRYQLDRLEDLGIFGTLPAGYEACLDPSNSYASHYIQNKHEFSLIIEQHLFNDRVFVYLKPMMYYIRENMSYNRGGKNYDIKQVNTFFTMATWNGITASLGKYENNGTQYRHKLDLIYKVRQKLPDLMYLAPVTDDTDPLNIYVGTEKLKVEQIHNTSLMWQFKPQKIDLNMTTILGFNIQDNALVRGYTYNTETGVRTIRSYNVDDCWQKYVSNTINWLIGKRKLFTLSAITRIENNHSSDMIGINQDIPSQFSIRNWLLSENLKLTYKLGKQSISLKGDIIWRNTTSEREDFTPFHATTINYGVLGTFALPGRIGFSTDFTFYTRRGYADPRLNTTDAVWNARLTYTFGKGKWVAMLDGYDMLHQLSNVTYAITAQARTISFTNTLPRYLMFHLQYRINLRPKKK